MATCHVGTRDLKIMYHIPNWIYANVCKTRFCLKISQWRHLVDNNVGFRSVFLFKPDVLTEGTKTGHFEGYLYMFYCYNSSSWFDFLTIFLKVENDDFLLIYYLYLVILPLVSCNIENLKYRYFIILCDYCINICCINRNLPDS